jgi:hypothetical protein
MGTPGRPSQTSMPVFAAAGRTGAGGSGAEACAVWTGTRSGTGGGADTGAGSERGDASGASTGAALARGALERGALLAAGVGTL